MLRLKAAITFIILTSLAWTAWVAPVCAETAGKSIARLISARPGIKALEAVFDVYEPDVSGDDSGLTSQDLLRQSVSYRAPNRVRINVSRPGRERVFLAVGSKTLTLIGDKAAPSDWPQPFIMYRLMLDSDPDRLSALLAELGFDMNTKDKGRWEGSTIFIIGAKDGDRVPPQAWIDDNGRLVRLIMPGARGMAAYDATLAEYRTHDENVNWPDRIQVKIDHGNPVNLVLRSLIVNPELIVDPGDPLETPAEKPVTADNPDGTGLIPEMADIRDRMNWLRKKYE